MKKKKAAQLFSIVAVLCLGDGMMGLLFANDYLKTWRMGPKFLRFLIDFFKKHLIISRIISASEIIFGLWIGSKVRNHCK